MRRPSKSSPSVPPCRRILHASILSVSALAVLGLSQSVRSEVIEQFTFPTTGTSAPTLTAAGVTTNAIAADPGVTLDLNSNQGNPPPTSPWLRIVPVGANPNAAAAVQANADFFWTITANAGFLLNLSSIVFDALKGGNSLRGFELRSSADNFATAIGSSDITNYRGQAGGTTMQNFSYSLAAPIYQGLSTITFKMYSYSPAGGASVEYDNIIINGVVATLPPTGYTWKGNINANWDTSTANWTGTGTTYVDGTATSDVIFDDSALQTAINVTPNSLNLHLMSFTNNNLSYIFAGSSITASGLNKTGSGSVTFNNALTAASISLSGGTVIVGAGGTMASPVLNVATTGTLSVANGGALSSDTGLVVNGMVTFNQPAQTVKTLGGVSNGVLTLNGTILNIANASSYDGKISGNGSLVKDTAGVLVLTAPASDFSGGTTINAGTIQIGGSAAGGSGSITVNAGGALNLGIPVVGTVTPPMTTPIVLNGGAIGAITAGQTISANVTVNGASLLDAFNAASNATGNDVVLTGQLLGSAPLTIKTVNGNAPDGTAVRLRGPSSSYSGRITVLSSGKFELQNGTGIVNGSPMGTGTLILTGGTIDTAAAGNFSLVNLRNNTAGAAVVSDTNFGNNVEVAGFGSVLFNMLGSVAAGSTTRMGDLLIGGGQNVLVGATASPVYTLAFSSVHLTGGDATFTPRPVGNTTYLSADKLSLGPVSENVPSSGIIMNGASTLTFTGVNTYTGQTSLLSGTTVLAAGASIASSASVIVAPGATLDAGALGLLPVPLAQILTVNGSLLGGISLNGILRGAGSITGPVAALGASHVSPGNSPGNLTTSNLDLQAGSFLDIELSKATPGSLPVAGLDYDSLSVFDSTGGVIAAVQIAGTLNLSVGAGLEQGDIFTIILNNGAGTVSGHFGGLDNGAVFSASGQMFQISYGDDSSTPNFDLSGGNDVSLRVVPEPGTALLLLGGLASCLVRRRFRPSYS